MRNKYWLLLALLLALPGCGSGEETQVAAAQVESSVSTSDYDQIMNPWLSSSLGVPYKWSGDNPISGYDCSGFVMEWMKMFGIGPRTDSTAMQIFTYFNTRRELVESFIPQKGALAFYGVKRDGKLVSINHVGLFITANHVAEAGGGDKRVLSAREAADRNAFVRVRPYQYRSDLVFILKPKLPASVAFKEEKRETVTKNQCDDDGIHCSVPFFF